MENELENIEIRFLKAQLESAKKRIEDLEKYNTDLRQDKQDWKQQAKCCFQWFQTNPLLKYFDPSQT